MAVPNVRKGRGLNLGTVLLVAACVLAGRGVALAQADENRVGPFAVDVHGVTLSYKPTSEQAAWLGYADSDLPGRGFGVDIGGQYYFTKVATVTLGAGGNVLWTAGNSDPTDLEGASTGNKAHTSFRSVAAQVTANFGGRRGWSYLSAGYGYSTFAVSSQATPEPTGLPRRATVNFGFGARWFQKEHLAFSFDVRFYKLAAQASTATVPSDGKQTRVVVGVGMSFR